MTQIFGSADGIRMSSRYAITDGKHNDPKNFIHNPRKDNALTSPKGIFRYPSGVTNVVLAIEFGESDIGDIGKHSQSM